MDLYAYSQIDALDAIADKNGIHCPRLRGYRLMKDEEPIHEFWNDESYIAHIVSDLCCSIPFWTEGSSMFIFSWETDQKEKFYLSGDEESKRVRWDRIHGWKRKVLKTAIHNQHMRCKKQYDTWNKYVGMDDVLYIHARIGGWNWPYYYKEVVNQPWFIEKVDDAFDSTYCDIYARISISN